MKYYSGIDLGGTKVYSIIINEKYEIIGRAKTKIKVKEYSSVISKILNCYEESLEKSGINKNLIESVGIGVPSPVNIKKGTLLQASNLGLKNIKLADILRLKLKKNVFVDNDVNMGTFAEYSTLKNKDKLSIYGVFLGTGIGGGYIRNGEIIRGHNYTAGEIGHMTMQVDGPKCNCGKRGCLEAIAAKSGIIKTIIRLQNEYGKKSIINDIYPDWQNGVNSSSLKKCYGLKDKIVIEAIDLASKTIGIALASIINLIGVDAIILGGGLYESLNKEMNPIIKKNVINYSMSNGADGVKIIKSKYEDDAVSFGAAMFVASAQNEKYLFKY